MKLIAFNGKMGVGKSTAISVLQELYPSDVSLQKFAGTLYLLQDTIYEIVERTGAYRRPDEFVKDRKLLQWLGTDWGRETLGQDIWTCIWKSNVQRALGTFQFCVVACDDVRFDNEAELVRTMGGVVVRIERTDSSQHADGGMGIANHASEMSIRPDLIDYTITNNGSLEDFKLSLRELYEKLGVGRSENAA